jgi:hypothetical protein
VIFFPPSKCGEFGSFFPHDKKIPCIGQNHIFQVEIWAKFHPQKKPIRVKGGLHIQWNQLVLAIVGPFFSALATLFMAQFGEKCEIKSKHEVIFPGFQMPKVLTNH